MQVFYTMINVTFTLVLCVHCVVLHLIYQSGFSQLLFHNNTKQNNLTHLLLQFRAGPLSLSSTQFKHWPIKILVRSAPFACGLSFTVYACSPLVVLVVLVDRMKHFTCLLVRREMSTISWCILDLSQLVRREMLH